MNQIYDSKKISGKEMIERLIQRNPNFSHPRLFVTKKDFDEIRKQIALDDMMYQWYEPYKLAADYTLKLPPLDWELRDGTRLLHTAQDLTSRTYALALTYQIERENRYAERLYIEMEHAGKYPSWGEKHFLDTAQILHAISIGYDWIYDSLTLHQRQKIRKAIVNLGLKFYQKSYEEFESGNQLTVAENVGWWTRSEGNWNPWCNSSGALAALAIGDEEPELAAYVLEKGIESLALSLKEYAPDGGYEEGIGYGATAIGHLIKQVSAMDSALGESYGLFNAPGIADFAYFVQYMNGPVSSFNFHDSGNNQRIYFEFSFFIANKLGVADIGLKHLDGLKNGYAKGGLFDLLWYKPEKYDCDNVDLPLDRYFKKTETGSFRSSWDETAFWLAFHGGENNVRHTHLDAGTFVLDAMGVNWAMDLGTEKLTYFGTREQMGNHFLLYRLAPDGHNTLVINPSADKEGQAIPAWNPVIDFKTTPTSAYAIMDLTEAYSVQKDGNVWDIHSIMVGEPRRLYTTKVNSALRGFALVQNRTRAVIQDELELLKPSVIWWSMHTKAQIEIKNNGKTALLHKGGKQLKVTLVAPYNAVFQALKAEPLPNGPTNSFQEKNKGIQKLAIRIEASGNTAIRVEFSCQCAETVCATPFVPLSQWSNLNEEVSL